MTFSIFLSQRAFARTWPIHKSFLVPQRPGRKYLDKKLLRSFSTTPQGTAGMVSLGKYRAHASRGGLQILAEDAGQRINVTAISEWSDEIELFVDGRDGFPQKLQFDHNDEDGRFVLRVVSDGTKHLTREVRASIPNQYDLEICVSEGNIQVPNEVKGDVHLETGNGDILVKKLQGAALTLAAPGGAVAVSKVAEGALVARAARFEAKLLKGDKIDIECEQDLLVGAVYSRAAQFVSRAGRVEVGGCHGTLTARAQGGGGIAVHDVNGAVDLLAEGEPAGGGGGGGGGGGSGGGSGGGGGGGVRAHFHALRPGSRSRLRCAAGPVTATLVPELLGSVRAVLSSGGGGGGGQGRGRVVLGEGLTIAGLDRNAAGAGSGEEVDTLEGVVEMATETTAGKKEKNFWIQQHESGSGKVDFAEAKNQALQGGYFNTVGDRKHQANNINEEDHHPIIQASSERGTVKLSLLSWMQSIQQRFGVNDL